MKMEWEEPPTEAFVVVPGGLYGDMAKELRKNEGKWAKVPREFASEESAKNTATRIRTGRMASFTKGEFEGVSHEKNVWVRYIGASEDAEEGAPEGTPGDQPAGPRLVPSRPARDSNSISVQIRAWGKSNGFPDLPNHGRLPQDVIQAYHAAMDAQEEGRTE